MPKHWVYKFKSPLNERCGKLAGLTVAVKDVIHIAGVPTSAGNPDWLASHEVPNQTASAVTKLINAGGIVVGKTLTDELAYSLNGVNFHYGTPVNFAAKDRIPGGSSSGSAAAVAHEEVDIGLGTDTGGSIRVPASYNGLFGLRPTHGEIPLDSVIPLAPSFDTLGWFTRDIELMRRVAEVLLPGEGKKNDSLPSRLVVLKPSIAGKKIWSAMVDERLSEYSNYFSIVDECVLEEDIFQRASEAFRVLQGHEIWRQHGEWITQVQPTFATDITKRFNWCQQLTEADVARAEALKHEVVSQIDELLPNEDAVMLFPTTPGAAPLLKESETFMNRYRTQLMGLTALAGLSGRPQLNLPVLQDQGSPWGLSLLGYRGADKHLISLAERLLENEEV